MPVPPPRAAPATPYFVCIFRAVLRFFRAQVNGTAVAVPRLIISILENFQQPDGRAGRNRLPTHTRSSCAHTRTRTNALSHTHTANRRIGAQARASALKTRIVRWLGRSMACISTQPTHPHTCSQHGAPPAPESWLGTWLLSLAGAQRPRSRSVEVPEALVPFMGGLRRITRPAT